MTKEIRPQILSEVNSQLEIVKSYAQKPNWDSYEAYPVSDETFGRARDLVLKIIDSSEEENAVVLRPYDISPVPTGGIYLEWRKENERLLVDLKPSGEFTYLRTKGQKPTRISEERHGVSQDDIRQLVKDFVK
jgi:hypothetical protein